MGAERKRLRIRGLRSRAGPTPADPHVDSFDLQLHDARLRGREQLVPQRVELQQRLPRLVLGDVVLLGPCRASHPDERAHLRANRGGDVADASAARESATRYARTEGAFSPASTGFHRCDSYR